MIDNLIERLPSPLYEWVLRFDYWLLAPRNICLYCVYCDQYEGYLDEGTCWQCEFQNMSMETDWQSTCRAFKKGKRTDEREKS